MAQSSQSAGTTSNAIGRSKMLSKVSKLSKADSLALIDAELEMANEARDFETTMFLDELREEIVKCADD